MKFTRTALIIVDVQNDFCEGGTLAVPGGAAAANRIAEYVTNHRRDYALVIATRDWHKPDDDNEGHFPYDGEEPDYYESWPHHCVQGTPGADYHSAIETIRPLIDTHIVKGDGTAAYSGFLGRVDDDPTTTLGLVLRHNHITEVHIVGLATDHCVKETATDATRIPGGPHLDVTVLLDLCAAVDPTTELAALHEMARSGVTLTATTERFERAAS